MEYEVIVGSEPTYTGSDKGLALTIYHESVILSQHKGSAAGQQVFFYEGDNLQREWHPELGENAEPLPPLSASVKPEPLQTV